MTLALRLLFQQFRDATEESGLVPPLAGMMGHGTAWGDFDGGGRGDLYVGGSCDRPDSAYAPAKGPVANRLLRNPGGRFERADQPAVEIPGRTSGAVFADLDGDGRLDLLVLEVKLRNGGVAKSRLPRKVGDLRFEDATRTAGLPPDLHGLGLAVADVHGDGRPDFFIARSNRLFVSENGRYVERADLAFAWKPVDGEDWPYGAAFGDLDGDYTAVMVQSPDGRLLCFIPGAHGSSRRQGTPVRQRLKHVLGGIYNLVIDPSGARLPCTFDGAPLVEGARRLETFGRPSVVTIAIPASER